MTNPSFSRRVLLQKGAAVAALAVFQPALSVARAQVGAKAPSTDIRPFHVDIPQDALEDLRRRISDRPGRDARQYHPLLADEHRCEREDLLGNGTDMNKAAEINVPAAVTIFPGEVYPHLQAPDQTIEEIHASFR